MKNNMQPSNNSTRTFVFAIFWAIIGLIGLVLGTIMGCFQKDNYELVLIASFVCLVLSYCKMYDAGKESK